MYEVQHLLHFKHIPKKLVNKEFQSISIILPREDAICPKVLQLVHLGGTPLI
jgi:hypothetical protein